MTNKYSKRGRKRSGGMPTIEKLSKKVDSLIDGMLADVADGGDGNPPVTSKCYHIVLLSFSYIILYIYLSLVRREVVSH